MGRVDGDNLCTYRQSTGLISYDTPVACSGNAQSPWDGVPVELIVKIFHGLSVAEVVLLSRVSSLRLRLPSEGPLDDDSCFVERLVGGSTK